MKSQVSLYKRARRWFLVVWWLRTPNTNNTNNFWNVTATGTSNNNNASNAYGVLCGFPP